MGRALLKHRIIAILLTAMLIVSLSDIAVLGESVESYDTDNGTQYETDVAATSESEHESDDPEIITQNNDADSDAVDDVSESLDNEYVDLSEESASASEIVSGLMATATQRTSITVKWSAPSNIEEASSCRIGIGTYNSDAPEYVQISADALKYTIKGLEASKTYTIRVIYCDAEENEIASSDVLEVSTAEAVAAPERRSLKSKISKKPTRMVKTSGAKYNLRKYAGEGIYGYSIVQGSCTDGTYSYHCLININTNWGKIVKLRISNGAKVKVSSAYYFNHGNGMCYDSKRNVLVVASYSNSRRTLTFVDPVTLKVIEQKNVKFGNFRTRLESGNNYLGITAIAYNKKYDCYIAMQKSAHNIVIYDAETLKAKAVALTNFDKSFTATFQSIDADDTYVYFLLSKNGSQKKNLIVAFDWHSEKLQALLNGTSTEDIWYCGSGDGRHSSVITLSGVNEIESLYHTDEGNGKGHFYLSNYNNDPKYKTKTKKVKWKKVTKKVKVKVKWKKVRKKVKWKKVKIKKGKNKGKYKWKYKTKKVWKYKYKIKKKKVWKYKKVKYKVFSHYNRDNGVYNLGVF